MVPDVVLAYEKQIRRRASYQRWKRVYEDLSDQLKKKEDIAHAMRVTFRMLETMSAYEFSWIAACSRESMNLVIKDFLT